VNKLVNLYYFYSFTHIFFYFFYFSIFSIFFYFFIYIFLGLGLAQPTWAGLARPSSAHMGWAGPAQPSPAQSLAQASDLAGQHKARVN
jgi:hypothetical protein